MNTGESFQLTFFRVTLRVFRNSWSVDLHLKAQPISDLFPPSIGIACIKLRRLLEIKGGIKLNCKEE